MLSSNDPVFQEVVRLASGFGIFDCIPCARVIIPRSVWMENLYSPILEVGREFQVTEQMF